MMLYVRVLNHFEGFLSFAIFVQLFSSGCTAIRKPVDRLSFQPYSFHCGFANAFCVYVKNVRESFGEK